MQLSKKKKKKKPPLSRFHLVDIFEITLNLEETNWGRQIKSWWKKYLIKSHTGAEGQRGRAETQDCQKDR